MPPATDGRSFGVGLILAIGGAVCAAGGLAVGLGVGWLVYGGPVTDVLNCVTVYPGLTVWGGAGCGLLAGLGAVVLSGRRDRLPVAIGRVVWATTAGAAGGGFALLFVTAFGDRFPAAVGVGAGWAAAGGLFALVGYSLNWLAERPEAGMSPPPEDRPRRRSVGAALLWTAAGAACAAGAWLAGLVLGRIASDDDLVRALKIVDGIGIPGLPVWIGAGCGLLAGAVLGVVFGQRPPGVLGRVLWTTATGAAGGLLVWLPVVAVGGLLPAMIGTSIGWAAVGAAAGMVGYVLAHSARPDDESAFDEEKGERQGPTAALRSKARDLAPLLGPSPRVLAVVGFAGLCLAAWAATPPSAAGPAVLALGLFGLVIAWALAGQERRLRRLEARVKTLERRRRKRRKVTASGRSPG
jgi:hypothetical protein